MIFVPLPTDTITSTITDSLSQKDTLSGGNFLKETGVELFEIFIKPTQTLYDGKPISHWENIWQFGFFLAVILLLAVLRTTFGNRMSQFLGAVMATRQLRQLMREEGFLYHPFSILLLLNAGIVYSLVVYRSVSYFEWYVPEDTGFFFFVIIPFLAEII